MRMGLRLLSLMLSVGMLLCLTACGVEGEISQLDGGDVSAEDVLSGDDTTIKGTTSAQKDRDTTAARKTTAKKTTVDKTTTRKTTLSSADSEVEEENFQVEIPQPAQRDPNKPWEQTRFFLSTFKGMPNDQGTSLQTYIKIAQLHKDANFTLMENAIMPRYDLVKVAPACEEVGIPFLVQNITNDHGFSGVGTSYPDFDDDSIRFIVEEMKGYNYLEGYYTWDEVSDTNFSVCKRLNGYFNKHDPSRLAYSIILPSYGSYIWNYSGESNWKQSSYYKYVTDYVKMVNPQVLGFDYYPFRMERGDTVTLLDNDMWRDMGLFRRLSLETGKPFWFYFQAYNMGQKYTFTNAMRSVQMYAALAYGAKTVSYFSSINCAVDAYGNKMKDYDDIKELNRKVNNLGNLLFAKKSEELLHFGIAKRNHTLYDLDRVEDSDLIANAPHGTIVSVFGDGSARKYVLVVNKSYKGGKVGTLTLKTNKKVYIYDHDKNKTYKLSNKTKTVDVAINTGDCALYVIE